MEKAARVLELESVFDWDDVGSWLAVPRLAGQDDCGNTVDGEFVGIDTKDCIIRSSGNHLIATLGVDDLIIVHTEDATLVARKQDSERIKEILAELKAKGRDTYL